MRAELKCAAALCLIAAGVLLGACTGRAQSTLSPSAIVATADLRECAASRVRARFDELQAPPSAELEAIVDRLAGLAASEEEHGQGHADTTAALLELAAAYRAARHPGESEALYLCAIANAEAAGVPAGLATAAAFNGLARVRLEAGRRAEAERMHERALAILESDPVADPLDVAATLNSLALLVESSARYEEALALHRRALAVWESVLGPEHAFVATSLNNLAVVYRQLARYTEAETLYERVLAIRRQALPDGDPAIATVLNNLAVVYRLRGRYAEAEPLFVEAITIWESADRHASVATALNNLAQLYQLMARYEEAESIYRRAQTIPDSDVATTLHNLASLYETTHRYSEAEALYRRVLAMDEEAFGSDHPAIATTLNHLADVLAAIERHAEAEPLLARSLAIREAHYDAWHPAIANSLNSLANLYLATGRAQETEPLYLRAEQIAQFAGEPRLSWRIQGNLMRYYRDLEMPMPQLAIYYGKRGINVLQAVRAGLRAGDAATEQSFLVSVEEYYGELAALLVTEGRLPEAQQVLSMLREEEYHEFIRRDGSTQLKADAGLTATEALWQSRHERVAGALVRLGEESRVLEQRRAQGALNDADAERLAAVRRELVAANSAFQETLAELKTAFRMLEDDRQRIEQERRNLEQNLMRTVAALGTGVALIQTVSLRNELVVLLTTERIRQAYRTPIEQVDFNRTVQDLLSALRDPRLDPRPAGQALYALLIGPLRADLEEAGIHHLMLSTDGVLRYVPLAVLHTGEEYLIETFTLSRHNEAAVSHLHVPSSPDWRVAALGVSEEHPGFSPLPAVPRELLAIAGEQGVLPGVIHLDREFTLDQLMDAVFDSYPVLHVASHFKFVPGTEEDSYLLLGDGTAFTLADFRLQVSLQNVDLLTLSACETAVGGGGRGSELEGLAVTAQLQGAQSVLATLWPVADETTASLMQTFYRSLALEGMSRAAALRRAQLDLLRPGSHQAAAVGTSAVTRGMRAAGGGESTFMPPPDAPYAHPYYWAPFILMGNWT